MALTHEPDPRYLVADTGTWAVCLNRNQDLLGRCYLLLRRPETDVLALTEAELAALWDLARRVRAALDALWQPDHVNYAFLMNLDKQVHFHLVPRYRDKREFAGGTFVDPAFGGHYLLSPERYLEPEGVDAVRAALRSHLR